MNPNSKPEIQIGKRYRHYKGKEYLVHGVAVHSESLDKLVYYECLYENDLGQFWVRPIDMFLGSLEVDGEIVERFQLID